MTATIYHDPDCATSRDALALIRNSGQEPRVVEYLKTPPSRADLVDLLRRMDTPVRGVLRRDGAPYDELGLGDREWADDQLVDIMLRHPALIDRLVVATPLGARLCGPAETVLSILPDPQGGRLPQGGGRARHRRPGAARRQGALDMEDLG